MGPSNVFNKGAEKPSMRGRDGKCVMKGKVGEMRGNKGSKTPALPQRTPLPHILMINRRQFATRAVALVAPAFIPNLHAALPNGKVRHASFGADGQALGDLMSFKASPHFEFYLARRERRGSFPLQPTDRHHPLWRPALNRHAEGRCTKGGAEGRKTPTAWPSTCLDSERGMPAPNGYGE